MTRSITSPPLLAVLAVLGFFGSTVSGCDNTINPIVEGAEGVFAVFGYLDTAADTQFVRIEGLRDSAFGPDPSLEGIEVVSVSAQGERLVWRKSSIALDDGGVGHLFFGLFSAEAGQEYTLEVGPPNGPWTTARVVVPPAPDLVAELPLGDSQSLIQSIRVPGVTQTPRNLTIFYEVRDPAAADPVRVVVDYGTGGLATSSGWEFDVFLARDRATVMAVLQRDQTDLDVELVSLRVLAELLSPEWIIEGPPQNISSGLGFFGAVGRFELYWELPGDFVSVLGFVDAQ